MSDMIPREDRKSFSNPRKRNDDHFILETMPNITSQVYVGNLPTDRLTDKQLLHFFQVFGKISDIRVYKDYLFIQYLRVDDAKKLIREGENCLLFQGHELDICSAIDIDWKALNNRPSSNYEPPRKRFSGNDCTSMSHHSKLPYRILSERNDQKESSHCQIILVSSRQKKYAEKIRCDLHCYGLISSIVLLRGECSLEEAVKNAVKEQYLYAVLLIPMHEQKKLASFHILHGQTEEHRNLRLEDGYRILSKNFSNYKKEEEEEEEEERNDSFEKKCSLSMLLSFLADGRQLTLEEIDRILVYLLEKKSKMLRLPSDSFPPLPSEYRTKKYSVPSSQLSLLISEQIEDILSQTLIKSSNEKTFQSPVKLKEKENPRNNLPLSLNIPRENSTYPSSSSSLISNENLSQSFANFSAANAAAAIFEAYAQFNGR